MTKRNITIFIIILLALTFAQKVAVKAYQEEMEKQANELKCVASLISLGVERKDIITDSGNCWVKGQAYEHLHSSNSQ